VQRIRRTGFSSTVSSQIVLAIVLSIVVHTYLVFGLPSGPGSDNSSKVILIEARLIREEPSEPRPRTIEPIVPVNAQPLSRTVPVPALPFVLPAVSIRTPPPPAMPLPQPEPVVPQPVAPVETRMQEPSAGLSNEESASLEVPDLIYHPASELDVYPSIAQPVIARIPDAAMARGAVTLLLMIDEFGKVNDARLLDSEPEGQYDEAVLQTYVRAIYSPAQKNGRMVRSRIVVRVDIEPRINAATP
jgi:periplasmic protein TonB